MTVVLPPVTRYFGEGDSPGTGKIAQDAPSPIIFHTGDHIVFHSNDRIVFHETYSGDSVGSNNRNFSLPRTVYSGEVEL